MFFSAPKETSTQQNKGLPSFCLLFLSWNGRIFCIKIWTYLYKTTIFISSMGFSRL